MVALDAPFVGTESWRGATYRACAVNRCSGVTTVDSQMVPLGRCRRELRSGLVQRGCITIELCRTVRGGV